MNAQANPLLRRRPHLAWSALLVLILAGTVRAADTGDQALPSQMSLVQAIALGIIEGLTEYLPVSSTGHLILAQRAMGIQHSTAADAYAICIQLGSIIAVVGMYFRYMWSMALGVIGRDRQGWQLLGHVLCALLPAALLGLLVLEPIMKKLFGLWPIVAAWFFGGVAILAVAWTRRARDPGQGLGLSELTWRKALIIGLLQCIAVWPGTSRSLVTIVGGVLVGLKLRDAVIFSFILGAVTLSAVTLQQALSHGGAMLEAYGAVNLLGGFAAAALSASLAVRWMVGYLKRHGLQLFGYYRVTLALLVAALLLSGVMAGE